MGLQVSRDAGFTLLEAMISLAILSGVVVTLIGSLNYHIKGAAYGRDTVIATVLGMEKMEEIGIEGAPDKTAGDFGEAFPGFTWEIADSELKDGLELFGIRRRDLTVVWGKGSGVSLSSYER
jgi:type II secretion system protein I